MKNPGIAFAAALLLSVAALPAQRLLHDLDPRSADTLAPGAVMDVRTAGNRVYFTAGEQGRRGVYCTDGTVSGTLMVHQSRAEIWPIPALTEVGSRVCWLEPAALVLPPGGVYELWCSDGTATGTRQLSGGLPRPCAAPASTGTVGYWSLDGEILESDGTPAGTRRLRLPSNLGCRVQPFAAGGRVFFAVLDPGGSNNYFVYTIPAPGQTPQLVVNATGGDLKAAPGGFQQLGNDHYCLVRQHTTGGGLFKISGAPPRLTRVHAGNLFRDVYVRPGVRAPLSYSMALAGGRLFFAAETATQGVELWSSNGTAAGTRLVRDITPGTGSAWPHFLVECNGRVVFAKASDRSGTPSELWVSDGTAIGTRLLSAQPANPTLMVTVGGTTFFSATDARGRELWKTDGTTAGTGLVRDIHPGAPSSFPLTLDRVRPNTPVQLRPNQAALGNRLLFSAVDGQVGEELWVTDGTSAGTGPLLDLQARVFGGYGQYKVRSADRVWFSRYDDRTRVSDLWSTDGVTATRVHAGPVTPPAPLDDDRVLFSVGGPYGQVMVASPGRPATVVHPGFDVVRAPSGRVYLTEAVKQGTSVLYHLYVTDGSPAGTRLLVPNTLPPTQVHSDGDRDYLALGSSSPLSRALYTDGTAAGTVFIPISSFARMTLGAGVVYFYGQPGPAQYRKYTGTAVVPAPELAIIKPVADEFDGLRIGKDTCFLTRTGFWKTDGTVAGTVKLATFVSALPSPLVASRGRVFFFADDGQHGRELWVSGLTPATTQLVTDLHPTAGQGVSALVALGASDRVLYFGDDGVHGMEPWISDGSGPGTRLVADLLAGPASSGAVAFRIVESNKRVIFSAMSGPQGIEPHVLDLAGFTIPIAERVGRGCAGTGAVTPKITALAPPTLGSRQFGLALGDAVNRAPYLLGLAAVRTPLTVGPCTLEIAPALVSGGTTSATGTARLPIILPNLPTLLGAEAVAQIAVSDPNGLWFGTASLTSALRVVIGR